MHYIVFAILILIYILSVSKELVFMYAYMHVRGVWTNNESCSLSCQI